MSNVRYGYNYDTNIRMNSVILTKSIDCSGNHIYRIDKLYEGLENLICSFNRINKIENLPNTLKTLDISYNRICEIDKLPEGLLMLDCRMNHIKHMKNIPKTLIYLYCDWRVITKIDNVDKSRLNFDYDYTKFMKQYNIIRKLQRRIKINYKKKNKSARIIQKGCEDWLWKPVCNDGNMGINVRIGFRKCEEIKNK